MTAMATPPDPTQAAPVQGKFQQGDWVRIRALESDFWRPQPGPDGEPMYPQPLRDWDNAKEFGRGMQQIPILQRLPEIAGEVATVQHVVQAEGDDEPAYYVRTRQELQRQAPNDWWVCRESDLEACEPSEDEQYAHTLSWLF